MKIEQATFITSVANKQDIKQDDIPEFAFAGRSNVGKSSFINSLVNQKKLVKTSSTPGRTRLINYFNINNGFCRFVDLPGYGYAQVGKEHKILWATLMEDYLVTSKSLKLVFFLVDIRHEPTQLDCDMQKFLFYNRIPYVIIATKCDKIAKTRIKEYKLKIAKTLMVGIDNIYEYSAETAYNKPKILELIDNSFLN